MLQLLPRKIDLFLENWKKQEERLPLIIKGARQIGKTESVRHFGKSYKKFVEINFIENPEYKNIFEDGFSINDIIKKITFIHPEINFVPYDTLIFFDEMQAYPNCATSLKFFKQDGRYDVICSGSLMGINYNEIESNSVGYKEDYLMHSLDFEEFLWAKGYKDEQIKSLYSNMLELKPYSQLEMQVMTEIFRDYVVLGGMPNVVNTYIKNKNFSNTLKIQRQLLMDYEEDITKYAIGLDKGKVKNVYHNISIFLGASNKKFKISKIAKGARNREYIGTVEWLNDAGVINVCYCLNQLALPLKGNINPTNYKLYYKDTGLLVASLDDEAQNDLRINRNFNTYKGAIYENIISDILVKSGYELYFYKNEQATLEMDFFVRDKNSLIPIEVKASNNASRSLTKLLNGKFQDIKFGIKFSNQNLGFNGHFFTFPYWTACFLRRFLEERQGE